MGVTHPNHVAYGTPTADVYRYSITYLFTSLLSDFHEGFLQEKELNPFLSHCSVLKNIMKVTLRQTFSAHFLIRPEIERFSWFIFPRVAKSTFSNLSRIQQRLLHNTAA